MGAATVWPAISPNRPRPAARWVTLLSMDAVLLVLAATAGWLSVLGWLYARGATPAVVSGPLPPAAGWRLNDLGVSEAGYERYVERGLRGLEDFLRAAGRPDPGAPTGPLG